MEVNSGLIKYRSCVDPPAEENSIKLDSIISLLYLHNFIEFGSVFET